MKKLLICLLFAPLFTFSQLTVERSKVDPPKREIRINAYSIHHFTAIGDSGLIITFPSDIPGSRFEIKSFILKNNIEAKQLLSLIIAALEKKDYSEKISLKDAMESELNLQWNGKILNLFIFDKDGSPAIMQCNKKVIESLLLQLNDPAPFA